jgi:hypothetical protein
MITVELNSVDITSKISQDSLLVNQEITHEVDIASFIVLQGGDKSFAPVFGDTVEIYDGSTKIFLGTILSIETKPLSGAGGLQYTIKCVDTTYEMDNILASKTYEDETIEDIIDDLVTSYAPTFTTNAVTSTFLINKIVFNQIPLSDCLRRLAEIVSYDWYIDVDKDIHFFPQYANSAPFNLTDTNGNYVYKSLNRLTDGSQLVNRVKVRGGEYNGALFSDSITVFGDNTKSFRLPYRFANLAITLDTGGGPVAQDVGIDFINDFTEDDVLYNYQEQTIRFENDLSDGDIIAFSGNPKVPVFATSEDSMSVAKYGKREKLIRDDSIESNEIARKRASAELYSYASPIIDARFRTYTAGLRSGMTLSLQSDIQGIDEQLIIKKLTFVMRDSNNFYYEAELISTKRYDFITLLQKLIQPDARRSDEAETSEEIFTDTQVVAIAEETDITTPFADQDQEIAVAENNLLDPLGDETDAEYVLSPYTPTGQTDTKRPGRLDLSLVAY